MQPTILEPSQDPEPGVLESSMKGQEPNPSESATDWGATKRFLFRFLFAYFVLYIFPFPVERIPAKDFWNAFVPWVGRHVFQVEITVRPNGSGDTTYNYVQVFCYLVMAVGTAAIWSLLDRKRLQYERLHDWLRVYVRFYLAMMMINYGSVKIIKAQFPDPPLGRLIQPFGEVSPMGLLWTFMGFSEGYNIFTGLGECVGGLLLTTRRTTLLGSLVCFGVLCHVTMLNFCYDVPVKLFSCHLLAMSLFLMAPDLTRLARLFLFNRPVEPAGIHPLWRRTWLDRGAIGLRSLWVLTLVWSTFQNAYQGRTAFGDLAPRPPFYGIWTVEQFEVDGQSRPPLITDGPRWRRVVFDHPNTLAIQLMSDARPRYGLEIDASQKSLTLTKREDSAWKTTLTYEEPAPDLLAVHGTMDGRKIRAQLRRVQPAGFHPDESGLSLDQ